jgi:hypothetical protein
MSTPESGIAVRSPAIGSPDQLFGEIGSFHPFAPYEGRTHRERRPAIPIEERYASRQEYLLKVALVARKMVRDRFLLPEDLSDPVNQAAALYERAIQPNRK